MRHTILAASHLFSAEKLLSHPYLQLRGPLPKQEQNETHGTTSLALLVFYPNEMLLCYLETSKILWLQTSTRSPLRVVDVVLFVGKIYWTVSLPKQRLQQDLLQLLFTVGLPLLNTPIVDTIIRLPAISLLLLSWRCGGYCTKAGLCSGSSSCARRQKLFQSRNNGNSSK